MIWRNWKLVSKVLPWNLSGKWNELHQIWRKSDSFCFLGDNKCLVGELGEPGIGDDLRLEYFLGHSIFQCSFKNQKPVRHKWIQAPCWSALENVPESWLFVYLRMPHRRNLPSKKESFLVELLSGLKQLKTLYLEMKTAFQIYLHLDPESVLQCFQECLMAHFTYTRSLFDTFDRFFFI